MIKAACHIHSDWSYDGKWSLGGLAAEFASRGYRVLLMTEHDRGFSDARLIEYREACARASNEKILIVPGIEYSDAQNIVHVLVWGVPSFLGEGLPTGEMLKQVRAAEGIAVFAHPSRKDAGKKFDQRWASDLLGVEFWNRKTDGWAPSNTAMPLVEDFALIPFTGMDFHTRRQFFPLATELEMEAPVSETRVLNCLKKRNFRCTALGRPAHDFMPSGWRRSGLRAVEYGRRAAAVTLRKLKRV